MLIEEKDSSRQDFIDLMLETNKQLKTGNVKDYNEDIHEDNYDKNGFLKADTKQMKKQKPMTIEVSIIYVLEQIILMFEMHWSLSMRSNFPYGSC